MSAPDTPIRELPNLGPKSTLWLADIGVTTYADLERIGPVDACLLLQQAGYPASLNLAYAIWGALNGVDWRRVPPEVREALRQSLQ